MQEKKTYLYRNIKSKEFYKKENENEINTKHRIKCEEGK